MDSDTKMTDAEAAKIARQIDVTMRRLTAPGMPILELSWPGGELWALAAWVLDQFERIEAEGPNGHVRLPTVRKTPTWALEAIASRRCATCAHWNDGTRDGLMPVPAWCERMQPDTDGGHDEPRGPNDAVQQHGYTCVLTGPDFGCVLWTAKE